MTRVRLPIAAFAATLLGLTEVAGAPVPKDARRPDSVPDLKTVSTIVGKAVENEHWPAEKEERQLRNSARATLERTVKAAGQKERRLPVEFANLMKADVTKQFRIGGLENTFLIAGDVRVTSAKNSVIFASGDVQITEAVNCVIFAQNVRCNAVQNSVVVAGECIRLNSARPQQQGDPGSVLVAGLRIRATVLEETICHVIRPGVLPAPDEAQRGRNLPMPAISTNRAKNVIYLNDYKDTRGRNPHQQTYLPVKAPIVR